MKLSHLTVVAFTGFAFAATPLFADGYEVGSESYAAETGESNRVDSNRIDQQPQVGDRDPLNERENTLDATQDSTRYRYGDDSVVDTDRDDIEFNTDDETEIGQDNVLERDNTLNEDDGALTDEGITDNIGESQF